MERCTGWKAGFSDFTEEFFTPAHGATNIPVSEVSDAYILRPSYLYGPMNNVYREAFVFDCALEDRNFYVIKTENSRHRLHQTKK